MLSPPGGTRTGKWTVRASCFSYAWLLRSMRPVYPAVKILLHNHGDRFLLVIAQLHFDLLAHLLARGVDREVHLLPLADHIECRAELQAHAFVLRRVVDHVLADELERLVGGIELATRARGQRAGACRGSGRPRS